MCGASALGAKLMGRRLDRPQGIRPRQRAGVTTSVKRCNRCGLVFADPLPIPDDISGHYDVAPEHYWAPHRLEAVTSDSDVFADAIAKFGELWKGSGRPRALDVGAGLGQTMQSLSRAGFEVHGIEPSPHFSRIAAAQAGVSADDLQTCSLETAEFSPNSFDFVSFGAVLEHVYDPATALDRAFAWCAPGALVYVEVPSADWLTARLVNLIYRAQRSQFVANLSPMHAPFHLYEFTPAAFGAYAAARGHDLPRVQRYVGDKTFFPRLLDPAARTLMEHTGTGMQIEAWLRKR